MRDLTDPEDNAGKPLMARKVILELSYKELAMLTGLCRGARNSGVSTGRIYRDLDFVMKNVERTSNCPVAGCFTDSCEHRNG